MVQTSMAPLTTLVNTILVPSGLYVGCALCVVLSAILVWLPPFGETVHILPPPSLLQKTTLLPSGLNEGQEATAESTCVICLTFEPSESTIQMFRSVVPARAAEKT